ncbi:class I SAM-dependent methyltransferase [bacterium]|nr:class I SAM-dependent methyltransferase [bacterium]
MEEHLWLLPDEKGEEEARFIKKALRLRKGQRVLDAPCGAGRITFHLAGAGCAVTGVDLRPQFVNRARRRFREEGLQGRFRVMDLRSLDFEEEFDGIFNWGGSFGYFSEKENLELLRLYARALSPSGRLLIDQVNREYILRHFMPEKRRGEVIVRNYWDKDKQRIISRRIVDGQNDPKNMSSMRLYTFRETKELFKQAGLVVEAFYGSFQGEEFRRSSPHMIAVGRKT